ncbi:MAG: phosphatidylserine/phosphatidylglycerophosphate/cardiolipin synthase family protein [Deltaproteobacteria bacterium]|nr:phosphatidylserine/phosphatidylglycerophosphate/cardiolipin synthase family protein [Deltaproteobacteria bacterium]
MAHRALLLSVSLLSLACATPQLVDPILPPEPASLRVAFEGMPGEADARIRVLDDNVDAWVAIANAVESARVTLDVTYFIIEPDAYGLAFLELLAERARAGVAVRLMVDARGCSGLLSGPERVWLQAVQQAGVDVRVYNPVRHQIAATVISGDLRRLAASNHDKLTIVDGRVVVAGGRNIAHDYLSDPRDLPAAYIDMDLRYESLSASARMTKAFAAELDGPHTQRLQDDDDDDHAEPRAILALALAAMRSWVNDVPFTPAELKALDQRDDDDQDAVHDAIALVIERGVVKAAGMPDDVMKGLRKVTHMLARAPHLRGANSRHVPAVADAVALRVLDTHSAAGPDSPGPPSNNSVNDGLLAAVQSAQRELLIQTPYLVLTPRALNALEQASARGVAITILTNSPASSDSPATQAAFLQQWPDLLARVPSARLYVVAEGRLMHAKVGVVDDQLAFVGSYNLDPISAAVNGEIVSAVWSADLAEHIGHLVRERIADGLPSIVEYRIERGPDGLPTSKGGKPVIVYGPDDHCTPSELASARALSPFLDFLAPIL